MTEDRVKLNADRHGFLTGTAVDDDRAARALVGIRSDTRQILSIMGGLRSAVRSRGGSSSVPRMSSAGGAASLPRVARDPITGRFIASPVRPSARAGGTAAQESSRAVVAAETMARVVQAQQRDQKQERLKNGRFGAGGDPANPAAKPGKNSKDKDSRFSGLGATAGQAVQGTENIDPLLASAHEIAGVAQNFKGAYSTARQLLFGKPKTDAEKAEAKAAKEAKKAARAAEKAAGIQVKLLTRLVRAVDRRAAGAIAGSQGLSSLFPGALGSMLPGAAAAAAATAAAAAAAKAAGKVPKGVGAGLRRLPIVGVLFEALASYAEHERIKGDDSLSDSEKRQASAENFGGAGGAIGGALLGAKGGALALSFLGPAGALVGGIGGGLVGGTLGHMAGKKAGGAIGRGWASERENLVSAAEGANVDPGLVAKFAGFESGFNANAKNPNSSAHGLGQFIDSTWVDTVRRHGGKYGIKDARNLSKEQILGMRGDRKLQAQMLAELTAENVAAGRAAGGSDDAANVYAMHNLGPTGGSKFLRGLASNPDAAISSVLSADVIAKNPLLYSGGTVGSSYAAMSKAMSRWQRFADDARALSSLPPILRAPGALAAMQPPGQMPQLDLGAASRISSGSRDAPAAPSHPPAGQDLPDRGMAHIFSGGIGAGMTHR